MNVSKILFIHPSRGRPEMAARSSSSAVSTMTSGASFRYVFSLDSDDPELGRYREILEGLEFPKEVLVSDNPYVIPAVNIAAARLQNEDLIINIADDFGFQKGWDSKLIRFISAVNRPDYLIHVTDLPNGVAIPVIQIVSAMLYRRLGYFFYPRYMSMYADQDLLEACQSIGAAIVYAGEPMGLEHNHPSFGRGSWDDTYARENRPECYRHGEAVLAQRRLAGFRS